jgi:SNF2 family DNA or RNA helicase
MRSAAPNMFMRGIRQRWPFLEPPLSVQTEALKRCAGAHRYGYWLEQGLGKTRLILAEAELLHGAGELSNLVVVCPNSVKAVWQAEAEAVRSSFAVVVWPDTPPPRPERCLFVLNYEACITSRGNAALTDFLEHDAMLVVDESIALKNPKAQRTKALLSLSYGRKYVRLLSGLPVVQNAADLWAQLRLLGADVNRSSFAFKMRYCQMGGWENRQVIGTLNEDELARIVEKVSFRALKRDWTDLPEKLYSLRTYTLSPNQRRAYGAMLKELVVQLDAERTVSAPLAVTQLAKLQEISSGFIIDAEGRAVDLVAPKDNPKLDLLEELLEQTAGKVIVFANFRHTLELCRQRWPKEPCITGGMDQDGIEEAMHEFNIGPAKAIFCQIQSAKYGLTLLGRPDMSCHTTVYLENSYSLDARAQSEDRNHRHGQRNPVLYLDVIGTKVERAALSILAYKQDMAASIMNRGSDLRQAMAADAR